MPPLYERYRPNRINELIGQEESVKQLELLRGRGGLHGHVYWIVGLSGSGKTTIARLIASEVADEYATVEMDAQDLNLEAVRQWELDCRMAPLGHKAQHCIIVNEAHGLSSKVVSRLQTVLEEPCVQRNSTWLFTTTLAGEQRLFDDKIDAAPFLSRAIELRLESRGEKLELAFAVRLREIAQLEQLDGQPINAYIQLVRKNRSNLRACLQHIESGKMMIPC